MIAQSQRPPVLLRQGRVGQRHRLRASVPAARGAAPAMNTRWARFWDDRRAVRLKLLLLGCCLLAGMLLEGPR